MHEISLVRNVFKTLEAEFPDKIGDVKLSQIQKIERIVKDPTNKFADMD